MKETRHGQISRAPQKNSFSALQLLDFFVSIYLNKTYSLINSTFFSFYELHKMLHFCVQN